MAILVLAEHDNGSIKSSTSHAVTAALVEAGYDAVNPGGGMRAWAAEDFEVVASERLNTLYHLQFRRDSKAGRGEHGMGSNCSGQNGDDVLIELPIGSVVRDGETSELLADLGHDGERLQHRRPAPGQRELRLPRPPALRVDHKTRCARRRSRGHGRG